MTEKPAPPGLELRLGSAPRAGAGALARLHARCFHSRGAPWSAHSLRSLIDDSQTVWAEAFAPSDPASPPEIVGFAVVRLVLDEAELLTICRDPNWSGHGLGARLLAQVVDWARSHAASAMFLEVAEGNQSARRLYADTGFEAVGRRPRYYRRSDGVWEDAIVLRTRF